MVQLSKTISVMDIGPVLPEHTMVYFHSIDEDTQQVSRSVVISREDWDDLGRPTQITNTIVPGDRLNVGDPAVMGTPVEAGA